MMPSRIEDKINDPRPEFGASETKARLYLSIDDQFYQVAPIPSDGRSLDRAFRIMKPDGSTYDVAETAHGPICDCPDFLFRRLDLDPAGCKHIKALASFGMIHCPVNVSRIDRFCRVSWRS